MSHINSFGLDSPVATPAAPEEALAAKPEAVEASPEIALDDIGAPVGKKEAAPAKAEPKEASKTEIKEEIKNLKKKYALTVNGKSEDVELDLGNDEEVKTYLQKARASDQKFKEAAEVRKAAMEFIDQLKKNPRKVLADPNIGIDIKKFAEEILNDEIKELEKSPEQREKDKLLKELEELKAKDKERDEQSKKSEYERIQAEQERILETEIATALDVGGMPKTPRTVKAMAEMMMIALENGIDLSPRDIAPTIKKNTMSEFKDVVASLSDDQLEDFLGKEVLGRLRKKNMAKVKSVPSVNAVKATGAPKTQEAPSSSKKQTYRSFFGI